MSEEAFVVVTAQYPAADALQGKELLARVIDPEIRQFERWFNTVSASPLVAHERDLLRAYLYHKLTHLG